MPELTFATGNALKFALASKTCTTYGIQLTQADLTIDEVQSEDPEYIALRKAEAAFAALGTPVVVTDDSWAIPALKGFPGPYMKSINSWFTPQDFLHLTQPLPDRSMYLTQVVAYIDADGHKVISQRTNGTILDEARGGGPEPWAQISSMEGDNGQSVAEIYLQPDARHHERQAARVWHEFAAWYAEYVQ